MKKRLPAALILVGLVIVFGGAFGFHFFKDAMIAKALAAYQPPPQTVSATAAKEVSWRPYSQAIGSLTAVNGVDVSSELAGKVVKIDFESGDKVRQGQLLVQLDDSQEQALLRQYQAQTALDKSTFERALALRKKNLNSKQDLDNAREQYEMSQAQVAQEQAVIAKKAIRAPFSGIVGIRQVNLGQYVTAGQSVVNLEQLDPLYVTFTLPQAEVPNLHLRQDVELDVDAYPNKTFAGKVTALDPAINDQSRTVQVQATIPNPDNQLRPGMFADIKVLADTSEQVTVVPATAINYSLYGDSVYVLTPQGGAGGSAPAATAAKGSTAAGGTSAAGPKTGQIYTAKEVFIKAGEQRGDLVAVTGIKPGDLVVTAGQIKLHSGASVTVNDSVDLEKIPELTP